MVWQRPPNGLGTGPLQVLLLDPTEAAVGKGGTQMVEMILLSLTGVLEFSSSGRI